LILGDAAVPTLREVGTPTEASENYTRDILIISEVKVISISIIFSQILIILPF
jgi:hypothetical protein